MNLTRLVYYSQRNPSDDFDINALAEICSSNNAQSHLTGFLHYNGDHFVQVIEGGRADVSELYHRIARDPRHSNIILLSFGDARERMFASSAMGLHQGMGKQASEIFLRYFPTDRIDPEVVNVDALLDALQDLMTESSGKLTISV